MGEVTISSKYQIVISREVRKQLGLKVGQKLKIADVKAAPGIHIAGRDKYENGKGQMLIKLFSL